MSRVPGDVPSITDIFVKSPSGFRVRIAESVDRAEDDWKYSAVFEESGYTASLRFSTNLSFTGIPDPLEYAQVIGQKVADDDFLVQVEVALGPSIFARASSSSLELRDLGRVLLTDLQTSLAAAALPEDVCEISAFLRRSRAVSTSSNLDLLLRVIEFVAMTEEDGPCRQLAAYPKVDWNSERDRVLKLGEREEQFVEEFRKKRPKLPR